MSSIVVDVKRKREAKLILSGQRLFVHLYTSSSTSDLSLAFRRRFANH